MRHVDDITLAQRREQMLSMNKTHIDLANKINEKLALAIDAIEPTTMKPAEISSLFKTAAELERKARIDTEAQEEMQRDSFVDPEMKQQKKQVATGDLAEVAKILLKAGALPNLKIKQTTTTEVSSDNPIDVEAQDVD
jgi:hypothetical protein